MNALDHQNLPGLIMLIDFEKAFDSVSWKFLYDVLHFFGFNEELIKWIKLFNEDFTLYVSQCGFLSTEIPIGRGCRQGDPISSYLFILGAQILTLLILTDPKVVGFKTKTQEYKLTQFADDTTLILDGQLNSLQAALNILEIFGNISGLRMNKEKTKVIWLGRKKHSKEKLKVSVQLDWGCERFKLLGITFDVDLMLYS